MDEPASWKKGIAEAIGTFALIYIGVMVLVVNGGTNPLIVVALAHALILAVMVSALMSISGGQFNPAVTLGLLIGGRISLQQSLVNWGSQLAGGILGGFLAKASMGGASIFGGIPNAGSVTLAQGILIEAIATFFLVMVVYGTAVDPRFGGRLGGLAIGLTIGADILAVGPLTGASMNTARWLGPAIAEGSFPTPVVHLVGPIVGAIAAGALFSLVLLDRPRPRPEPQAQMRAKDV